MRRVLDGEPSGRAARPGPDGFRASRVRELVHHRGRDVHAPEDRGEHLGRVDEDEVMERRRIRDDDHPDLTSRSEAA